MVQRCFVIDSSAITLYTLQLSFPELAGQVGDLVWHVYVSVPVSIRCSSELLTNLLEKEGKADTLKIP